MRNLLHAAAALAVVGLLAAGCSTSDDGAGESSEALATTTTPPAPRPTPLAQVQVGECVLTHDLSMGRSSGVSELTVVDCDTPDSAPVTVAGPFTTTFSRGDGRTDLPAGYPGYPNMMFIAIDECQGLQGFDNPDKRLNYAFPNDQTWDAGDQVIVCVDPDRVTETYLW